MGSFRTWAILAALAFVAGLALILSDIRPPKTLTLAAGPAGGGYHKVAERYREVLARDGIEVQIVETAGSVENAGRLERREVDAAILQGGIPVNDPDVIESIERERYHYLQADASSEEALEKAGVMTARGLVTAVRSDADNVFITLTAKGLRPDLFILSRTSDEKNELKLLRAGATRVVSPYLIGGRRMAHVLKRPTVVDFIDSATVDSHLDLMMEEALLTDQSAIVGKQILDSGLRQRFDVIVVAIKRPSGEMVFNPRPAEILSAGDLLVVLGMKDNLSRLKEVL